MRRTVSPLGGSRRGEGGADITRTVDGGGATRHDDCQHTTAALRQVWYLRQHSWEYVVDRRKQ